MARDGEDCCVLDAILTLDFVLFYFLCRSAVWIVFIPTGWLGSLRVFSGGDGGVDGWRVGERV